MKSIRWRILIPFFLLAVVTLGGIIWYLTWQVQQDYIQALQSRMQVEAGLLANSVADLIKTNDKEAIDQFAKQKSGLLAARVTVIDVNGNVLGESGADSTFMENHLNRPEVRTALSGNQASDIRFSDTLLTHMLYTAAPVFVDGKVDGVARVAISLGSIKAAQVQLQRNLTIIGLIALLLTILISYLIAEYTTLPIRQLTRETKRITGGEFQPGKILDRKDEIGVLSRSFHEMADSLKAKFNELATEKEKLYAILNTMSDGVIIVDTDRIVQLVNPAAESLFKIEQAQSVGHSLPEVLRHYQFVDLWNESRESGETKTAIIELGVERRYLQAEATPLGGPLQGATMLLIQDLTRMKKLETVRQDFISNVSHELRTPLASLRSLTETLNEGAIDDPKSSRKFLGMMDDAIDTMSQIVQELLHLSRIESGKDALDKKLTSIDQLIHPAVERMALQAKRAGLTMEMVISTDLPEVNVDVEKIQQVMVNILHNAIKFTPPGGKITVSAVKKEEGVLVSIADTGVGIAEKDLSRIFERFYKADKARSGGGTGLGLSISRHIVESHGGKIWAESTPGEGSTFFFTL